MFKSQFDMATSQCFTMSDDEIPLFDKCILKKKMCVYIYTIISDYLPMTCWLNLHVGCTTKSAERAFHGNTSNERPTWAWQWGSR